MDNPARFPRTFRLANATALLLAAGLALLTAVIAWQCQWSGPFRDLWEVMPLIERSFTGSWQWQDFWAAYGGAHRLVLPRLLFVAEYHLTGGSNYLVLCVSLSCLLLTLALLVGRVRQCHPGDHAIPVLAAAMACITLFSPTQLFNLNYSYDTQWFQAVGFSTLALCLASDARLPARPALYSSSALLAGLAASLSNMAGLLAWPSLLLLLWHNNPSRVQRLACACTAALVLAVYAYGLAGSGAGNAAVAASAPNPLAWLIGTAAYLVQYSGLYLGSPATRAWPVILGIAAIGGMALLLADAWRNRHATAADRSLRLLLGGLALQVLLVAMATAWGRRYYPLDMAMAERFQAISMLAWLCLGLGSLAWLRRRGARWALLLPLLVMAGLLAPHQLASTGKHIDLASTVAKGHLGAGLGLTGMPVASTTLSYPAIMHQRNHLARHNGFLQRQRLAYFRDPLLDWIGQATPALPAAADCQLRITYSMPVDAHGTLELWGVLDCPGPAPDALLLPNRARQVSGLLVPPRLPGLREGLWSGYATAPDRALPALAAVGRQALYPVTLHWPDPPTGY